VKNKQIKLEKELGDAQTALAGCSYIANPQEWSILLNNVTDLAVKLSDINKELRQLERKLISCSLNRFNFVVYF